MRELLTQKPTKTLEKVRLASSVYENKKIDFGALTIVVLIVKALLIELFSFPSLP